MANDINESQRRIVAERAAHRCEYCLVHEDDSYSAHQIDHILSHNDHFVFRGAVIEPLTAEGNATARLLKLNIDKRVVERQLLATAGRYPR